MPQNVPQNFQSRFEAWQRKGLSSRACSVLALAGCNTVEQVRHLGRAWFERRPNVGIKTITELQKFAGWTADRKSPVDVIAITLRLSIPDIAEAREAAQDTVLGLERAGYVIAMHCDADAKSLANTDAMSLTMTSLHNDAS